MRSERTSIELWGAFCRYNRIMNPVPLHELVHHLDDLLRVRDLPDDPNAVNGLQLEACAEVERVALAVDASEAAIDRACALRAQLLVVHHGLLWSGNRPLVGAFARKLSRAFSAGLSIYSAHLPLDLHPEYGNNVGLARAVGLEIEGPFGRYQGIEIGVAARCDLSPDALAVRLTHEVGPTRLLGRGPTHLRRVAVVSGGGSSLLGQAAASGFDALVTGEAPHHTAIDAEERGIHLYLSGHYRTEVFGVKSLGERLAERFGLSCAFLEADTGL